MAPRHSVPLTLSAFLLPLALTLTLILTWAGPALAARHALLIGVSDYADSGFTDLPGAQRDLVLVDEVLRSRLGFAPAEIRVLRNGEATHTGIARAFADLAQAAGAGDRVFVHYSGHGSLVTDFNDDEDSGKDQTLVPFAARRESSEGIDRFDILDDELNRMLGRIADRIGPEGELVVVTDACHSATNTRGPSPLVSRALPDAVQESHPMARGPSERHPLANAIRIGAAADDERAFEYSPAGGHQVGLFTHHWVEALARAEPTDTWRQVFERAGIGVSSLMPAVQHPQIIGERADRTIGGGALRPRPGVMVTGLAEGKVTLDAGALAGVTVGSLYARSDSDDGTRLQIVAVGDVASEARLESGRVKQGDYLVELKHAYRSAPVRLFLWPVDGTLDPGLLKGIRSGFQDLPGFVWVERQADADLSLAVLRPGPAGEGAKVPGQPARGDALPEQDPAAAPEVWVLDRGERPVHEALRAKLKPGIDGTVEIARLRENLGRYRRQMELRRLPTLGLDRTGIAMSVVRLEETPAGCDGCIEAKGLDRWLRPVPVSGPAERVDQGPWPKGSMLSFSIKNGSLRDQYLYLYELAPDGSVGLIHPMEGVPNAPLARGATVALWKHDEALLLDAEGRVSVLLIATQRPIRPWLPTQAGFERRRGDECRGDPLECLLMDAFDGTRNGGVVDTGTWGARLLDFRVRSQADGAIGPTPTETGRVLAQVARPAQGSARASLAAGAAAWNRSSGSP